MEFKTEKTIRIRKVLKVDQECKYIIEAESDGGGKWMYIRSFMSRERAEGFVEGLQKGIQYFTTPDRQIAVPIFEDQWQVEAKN